MVQRGLSCAQVADLEKTVSGIEMELKRCEMDINASAKQQEQLKAQQIELAAAVATTKDDTAQQKKLEKSLASISKEVEKAQEKVTQVEEEMQELQQQILDVGGIELKQKKSEVQTLKEQIDQLQV